MPVFVCEMYNCWAGYLYLISQYAIEPCFRAFVWARIWPLGLLFLNLDDGLWMIGTCRSLLTFFFSDELHVLQKLWWPTVNCVYIGSSLWLFLESL